MVDQPILTKLYNFARTVLSLLWVNIVTFSFYCFLGLLKGKGCCFTICKWVSEIFKPRISVVKQSKPILPGKTMFFANHRSWADFFMDGYMTGGSSYLARLAVIVAVPGPSLSGYLFNFVWFFHRKTGIDRSWFTDFFRQKWSVRPNNGCVVYPEGHRYKGEGTLVLKTGVMEAAYNMNIPCQVVLTNGKEDLLDEVNFKVNKGQQLTCCVSEVMKPDEYKTKEEWFEKVRSVWKNTYETLNKNQGVTFVDLLPGVDKDKCGDEPILPSHAAFVLSGAVILFAIIYGYSRI